MTDETTTKPEAYLNDRSGAEDHRREQAAKFSESASEHARISQDGIYSTEIVLMNENAKVPTLGTPVSAGYDLYAAEDVHIPPFGIATIPLGFATNMPNSIHGRIESRSGMAIKGKVVLTGVIDADYRGEWKVIMGNLTAETVEVAMGDRVAQVVFRPTVHTAFDVVEQLTGASERGTGGFGSTGTR